VCNTNSILVRGQIQHDKPFREQKTFPEKMIGKYTLGKKNQK